ELEAERARRLLRLAHAKAEQDVVEVDRRELARGTRQRRRRLHLKESAKPRRGKLDVTIERRALQFRSRFEIRRLIRADAFDLLDEGRREIGERGSVCGFAVFEELVGESEPRVRALVLREDLDRDLVRIDGEHRIQTARLRRLVGIGALEEGFLRGPDRRGRLLALLHQVRQVRRSVLALVAKVALLDGGAGEDRVAEELRVANLPANADGLSLRFERDANARCRSGRRDLARRGVTKLENRSRGHVAASFFSMIRFARRSDRYAALRMSSLVPSLSKASSSRSSVASSVAIRPSAAMASRRSCP